MNFNPKSCLRSAIPKMNSTAISVYYPDKYIISDITEEV